MFESHNVKGGVWYHENGHLVDYNGTGRSPLSRTYVSKYNGKTLNETLQEEAKSLFQGKGLAEVAHKYKAKILNDYF